jgi:hypothetical protein
MLDIVPVRTQKRKHHRARRAAIEIVVEIQIVDHRILPLAAL